MVDKRWLVATNSIVFILPGIKILTVGIGKAVELASLVWLWAIPVFVAFMLMFRRVIGKNTARINALPGEKASLLRFLSPKGYVLILSIIALGIGLKFIPGIPVAFFAFFYPGLGSALILSGAISLCGILAHSRSQRAI